MGCVSLALFVKSSYCGSVPGMRKMEKKTEPTIPAFFNEGGSMATFERKSHHVADTLPNTPGGEVGAVTGGTQKPPVTPSGKLEAELPEVPRL